ncbi:MAG: SpoIIE family protein phosphatase [Thiohalocapsa sp.]|jgi:sigma-B regulation protein RsbU (phosphoserine phosphatase)
MAPHTGQAPPNRSLIVEDDAAERIRLQCMLERLGFEVFTAENGADALALIEGGFSPGLIVSDWQMPQMDGPSLCRRIRQLSGSEQAYFILVTGRTCPSAIEDGLDAGADDFIGKPYRAGELRARVRAGQRELDRRVAARTRTEALANMLADRSASERLLQTDLEAAARLQRRQRPPRLGFVGGIEVGHFSVSAGSLAGDAFGCVALSDHTVGFYLLDVVGHGVSAALNSFALGRVLSSPQAAAELFSAGGRIRPPGEVVGLLNERFQGDDECDQYFTMVYGTIDTASGQGALCQAGHPYPIILRNGATLSEIGHGGYPVGMLPEVRFEDVVFTLGPGERLVIYSDGVPDVADERGQRFGPARLREALLAQPAADVATTLSRLETQLNEWRGSRAWEDDASIMVLARQPETN